MNNRSTSTTAGNVPVWRKGALHVHTLWSDGRSLPEVAVKSYRDLGFDFVCISEHNVFPDEELWLPVAREEGKWPPNLSLDEFRYAQQLFPDEIISRRVAVRTFVRLRTFAELQEMFAGKDRFLLVPGEEITVGTIFCNDGETYQTHFNIFNFSEYLPPLSGADPRENLRKNFAQYKEKYKGDPEDSFFMVNHPQARLWDIDPVLLVENPEIKFFEICNSDSTEPVAHVFSLDKFWDFVLAHRLHRGCGLIYATASDDAHFYREADGKFCSPGTGWVMVKTPELTAEAISRAMYRGDFYATCGVELENVDFDSSSGTLKVAVKPEDGVDYIIRFIVTKKDFDRKTVYKHFPAEKRFERTLPVISDSIGITALEISGTAGEYTLGEDDLYVRAVVISDKKSPVTAEKYIYPETTRAWTQPFCKI